LSAAAAAAAAAAPMKVSNPLFASFPYKSRVIGRVVGDNWSTMPAALPSASRRGVLRFAGRACDLTRQFKS
jgi:hypothetical protein